jgi:arylsulfatase A-like enzyme
VSGVILFLFGTVLLSLFLATAYTVSSATNISTNRVTGATGLSADFWVKALRSEAGPLITLGNDLAPESLAPGEHWPAPSLKVSERKRLRIPLAAYQAQIPKGSPQYNVLIVLVESLRSDTLTELGSTRVVMPHLEELAARSVVFARAYAQATHSSYSDPTALSSQFPLRAHRYQDYPREIPYPHVLIYELLKPRGYTTAIISSQNELWGGMLHYLKTPALDHLFHAETYHRHYVHEKDSAFAKWTERYQRSGKIDDADTMDELLRFIEETREPFFVYTNLQNSHFPYRYPDPDQAPFQPQRVDFSYTFSHYPPSKVGIVKNRYHNALHFIDSQLGRLFDTLSRLRLWENTIVVITGDTGQAFHEHGRVSHGTTPYEELIHIPIVVSAPDLGSRVSQRLSSQADIPPTVLELLGMPPHPAFQGVSMLDNAQRLPVFTMVHVPAMRELAVIDGTMKLIMDGEGKRLLFDLSKDPQEKTNLWARDSEAGQRLLNLLLSYRQTQLQYYGDPTRWNNEYPPVLNLDPR